MTLRKIYKQVIVKPAIILVGLASLFALVFSLHNIYTGEEHSLAWYEALIVCVISAFVYSLIMALLSVTIFLNQYASIASSTVLSGLSWFLLPFTFIFAVIGKAINEFLTVGSVWELTCALLAGLPFLVGLVAGFLQFRKLVKATPPEQYNS